MIKRNPLEEKKIEKGIINANPLVLEETRPIDEDKTLFYLKTILGYKIIKKNNIFILRSIYSFSSEDQFIISIKNNKIILEYSNYLDEWEHLKEKYINKGKSVCAFLSAVTLELFCKKTFG